MNLEGCKMLAQQYFLAAVIVAHKDEERRYLFNTGIDLHCLAMEAYTTSNLLDNERGDYLLQVTKQELMIYYHYNNKKQQYQQLCHYYGHLVLCAFDRVQIKDDGSILDFWLVLAQEALETAIEESLVDLLEFGPHQRIEYSTRSEAYSHLATYAYRAGKTAEKKDDDHYTFQACWKNLSKLMLQVEKYEKASDRGCNKLEEGCSHVQKNKKRKKKKKSY